MTNNNNNKVAIVGLGFRLPGGSKTPTELWSQLLQGFDGVSVVTKDRWSSTYNDTDMINNKYGGFLNMNEWKCFDSLFFGISPKEAPLIDPQQRILLTLVWEALEDAGISPTILRGTDTGVFMGVSNHDYMKLQYKDVSEQSPYAMTGSNASIISNRISYCYDFRGPSLTVDTACSSSLASVSLGLQSIANGDCKVAICGGVNALLDPSTSVAFSSLGVLNPDGRCKTFDADANGYVRGEGAGIVILKSLEQAEKDKNRIYGVILGSNMNEDGSFDKSSLTTPSGESQSKNIASALEKSELAANDIYYVECHGTGTPVGDPIEVGALSNVFTSNHSQDFPLKVGSFKTNIGHLESAAGIASLIKSSLMLKNRMLVPSIHFNQPNPKIPFDQYHIQVVNEIEVFPEDQIVNIGINSFGFGGANCHLVVQEYINQEPDYSLAEKEKYYMVPTSSNSEWSLDKYEQEVKDNTNYHHMINFQEFALHQSTMKANLLHRKVVIAKDWKEYLEGTNPAISNVLSSSDNVPGEDIPVCFVFVGQGPQWNGMGRKLYEAEPVFKDTIDICDDLLKKYCGYSVWEKIGSIAEDDQITINTPIIAQPALFLIQMGLVALYGKFGIQPSMVIGHSFGEVTSAYFSGAISLESAIKIVYYRSMLQNKTIGSGKMLAISLGSQSFDEKYGNEFHDLEIACYNAPESIVVTGKEDRLKELASQLTKEGIFNAFLKSPCSFHSSYQKAIKKEVLESLADLPSTFRPMVPLFSTVYGDLQTTPVDAQYIYKNLREPVHFEKAISNLSKYTKSNQHKRLVYLEITPHPTLAYLINKCGNAGLRTNVMSALHRSKDELLTFYSSVAQLYCQGVNIDFGTQFDESILSTNLWKEVTNILPRYQWESDTQYWNESLYSHDLRLKGPTIDLIGWKKHLNGQESFETIIDVKKNCYAYLKDHKVRGKPIFPGAGYLDIILEAVEYLEKHSNDQLTAAHTSILIQSIEFLSPFFLVEGEQQHLQTTIDRISKNVYQFQFYQKDSINQKKWSKMCKAKIQLNPQSSSQILNDTILQSLTSVPKVDLLQLKADCDVCSIDRSELYHRIVRLGLGYGKHFQVIDKLWVGPNFESLCLLSFDGNEVIENHRNNYKRVLNAMVLDNCFHGVLGILEDSNQHFVVERVDKMQVYPQTLFNQTDEIDQLYLYTRILNPTDHSTQVHATCQLIGQDGQVIVEVGRFTLKSLEKYKVNTIKKPSDQVYTINWQSKESSLPIPTSIMADPMTELHDKSQVLVDTDFVNYCCLLLKETLETISGWDWTKKNAQTMEQYMKSVGIDTSFTRFLTRLFEIHSLVPSAADYQSMSPIDLKSKVLAKYPDANLELTLIERATSIIPRLLQGDSTACHSLFENNLLSSFYTSSTAVDYYLEQVGSTIQKAIGNIVTKSDQDCKKVIKILEVGGGTGSLTTKLLTKLASLFEGTTYEKSGVEVVYTFTDISASFINSDIQSKFQKVIEKSNGCIKMVYKTLNLELDYASQSFLPSDYDCIVMSYVLHAVADLEKGIRQLYDMLAPNGWLMFIEPSPKMTFSDIVFGCFHQWWQFSDQFRTEHCAIRPNEWSELLCNQIGGFRYPVSFINFEEKEIGQDHSFVVHAQKQSISEFRVSRDSVAYCSMIVPGSATLANGLTNNGVNSPTIEGRKSLISKYLRDSLVLCQEKVDVIETELLRNPSLQDEKTIEASLSKSSIAFFMTGVETLNGNYQLVTYQLTKLFQLAGAMAERGVHVPKIVVLTKCAQRTSKNYLNASLIGLTRTAMNEYADTALQIYSIDIEEEDTADLAFIIKLVSMEMADKEYIVKKDGAVLVPRLFQNRQLIEPVDAKKSQVAYETNVDKLYCKSKQSLDYQFCTLPEVLAPNDIEIKVQAVGVNFKDNLFYKGLLPAEIFRKGDIYNPPFGLECSGTITRIGSAVSQWKIGDQVLGFARHSLASHVTTSQHLVVQKPESISYSEAASLPVVYCTAYHSLFKVNHMDEDETALIHSATGGVGLACLNLLKMKGAADGSIYATVGSKDKKNYLVQQYGSMIKHIYSTRDKEYAAELRGKIDCLVNTLSGEYTQSNFESMSSFGRIADLSVTHIYANEPLDMGNFKGDIQYCGVDLERLIDEKPKQLQKMLETIVGWVAEGKLNKLPIQVYAAERSKEAIESLGERGHIGKIIIDCSDILHHEQKNEKVEVAKSNYLVDLKDTIIITGQTGISLQIIAWFIKHSKVSHIIVISKSSLKWKLEKLMKEPHKRLVNIVFASCDVSVMENLTQTVKNKLANAPPVRAVFHLAAVYDDVPISKVTAENISNVHNPKVLGAINLHRLSIINCWKLSHFILFSSITGVIGYYDQAAYNSANAVLDSLANFRRQAGLPALAINWGPLDASGKVAENEAIQSLFASRGLPVLSIGKFFGALEAALNQSNVLNTSGALNLYQLVITPMVTSLFFDSYEHMRPKMEHLIYAGSERNARSSSSSNGGIGGASQKESFTSESVLEKLTNKVSDLLSINKSKLNLDTKLKDYGLDSLLTVQFKGWIDKEFENKNLFSHIQLSSSSINDLVEKVVQAKGIPSTGVSAKAAAVTKKPVLAKTTTPASLPNPNMVVGSTTPVAEEPVKVKSSPMVQKPMQQPKQHHLIGSPKISANVSRNHSLPSSVASPLPPLSAASAAAAAAASTNSSSSPMKHPAAIVNRRLSSIMSPSLMQTAPTSNNNPYILGIGTAVPNEPLKQSELSAVMSKDFSSDPLVVDKVSKIFEQSQINTRYLYRNPLREETALRHRKNENINDVNRQFQKCAPDLSQRACEKAIKEWGGSIQDITHIVSVSSTGVVVPDINFVLIQRLGLNKDIERLSVNFMGCLAGLSSMRAAVPLASKHPKNRVLVVCTEICSTHFSTKEGVDQIVASTIFADGSAAYILGCNPTIYEHPLFEVIGSMTRSVPDTAHTMTWDISTDGWDLGLDQSIPHHIGGGIESFVNDLLAKNKSQTQDLTPKECEFLIHTGGKAILMSIEQSLGITSKQNQHSWDIYRNYGNMSSASVIFVLEHARHSKSLPQYSISLAFGPGLAFEGCVLKNMV
ncbi:putative polyketide synthase [Cavenderia fasciculata]|uniref:Polyketide synthase n=1 Tax=Cavenderia fasciculata TaxID=261658 RepID=F4Q2Z0_CACFS|nr:putative polyketide synthase [Cavenderia fasciculata]EGG17554.1 putative polyketide synthase [Cavenderia fasciculata]|eukprot:XP_004356038.1 putative polyketide synthase [Cavenderia fasciculata]